MNAIDTSIVSEFREAPRDLRGLTSGPERAVLRWLVPRVPAWLTPDRLTGAAFASMLAGGVLYWMSGRRPELLHAVNACLFANWLGDSLDGAVAKYRGRAQPRYGFYIDHILDNVGVAALLGGLCASGFVMPALGAAVVVLYLLFQLHMHMTVYTRGVFQMSFAGFGGTELRLLLVLANLAVLIQPRWALFGWDVRPYDAIAATAGALLVGSLIVAIVQTATELERVDAAERK